MRCNMLTSRSDKIAFKINHVALVLLLGEAGLVAASYYMLPAMYDIQKQARAARGQRHQVLNMSESRCLLGCPFSVHGQKSSGGMSLSFPSSYRPCSLVHCRCRPDPLALGTLTGKVTSQFVIIDCHGVSELASAAGGVVLSPTAPCEAITTCCQWPSRCTKAGFGDLLPYTPRIESEMCKSARFCASRDVQLGYVEE